MKEKRDISIYIHIPFCERKCNYCAFNSFCAGDEVKEKYIDLLCKEIVARKVDREVKTVYIGGGTPSILSAVQITKIVRSLRENFRLCDNAEFTIEANPNSITESLLKTWKSLGINRLSVGVQSLSDESLKKIGRLHDRKMALEKIAVAKKHFDNVSCDLIVGLEGESGEDLCSYACDLLALGIKHISCYLLEVYDGTPLHFMISQGQYAPLDDEKTVEAFGKLADFLRDAGMEHYEISNFAFPSYESKHNLNYWARGEYLGFGIGAHSFVDGVRGENAQNLKEYEMQCENVADCNFSFSIGARKCWELKKSEKLSLEEEDEEKIMLGLRCCLGVDLRKLRSCDITKNPYFHEFLSRGILIKKEDDENVVTLNPHFYHVSNTIISNLFE